MKVSGGRGLVSVGLVLAACVTIGHARVGAAGDDLEISGVDISGSPEVSIEISAPAGRTGGEFSLAQLELLENGVEISPALEQVPTSGLEVVLLIDTSGSMKEGNAIGAAKDAAVAFLASLPADVPVGVVSFADAPALVSPLTTDRVLLTTVLTGLQATGETSLYDAMQFGQSLFSGGTDDRQFVLLSDGGDTVSTSTPQDAIDVATVIRTNVIELVSSEANHSALEQISAAGSGTISLATDPAALDGLYQNVALSLINRYRLVFTSEVSGDVTYIVRLTTPTGVLEATAATSLPVTVVAPTTTTEAVASSTSVPTSTVPILESVAVAGGAGSGTSGGTWLLVGAGSLFCTFLILGLMWIPRRGLRSNPMLPEAESSNWQQEPTSAGLGERISTMAEGALERRGQRKGLSEALEVAAINLRPGEFLVLSFTCGIVLAALLFAWIGPLGLVLGVVLMPLLARLYVRMRADKRRKEFGEQLPDILQMLVSSLRSGFGLPQALDAVANQVAEPARAELQRVLLEVRIGRDPTEALQSLAKRIRSRDFEWVVAAIHINREVGGELAVILENVGETVRERQQLARQVQTLTAEGRLSAYVLIALPILLVVLLSVLNPGYFDPMTEPPGPFLIVLGVLLLTAGWLWMRRQIKAQL